MMYTSPTTGKQVYKDDRIEDIFDLQYLKQYACQKVKYRREWALNCMDCQELKKCKAGQQAMLIMEKETKAPEVETDPERKAIADIFGQPDPIKMLLSKYTNMRGPSVYAKVNVWRKNHPDLEEKYHMMEKVRFLWRKPYDQMRVEDIFKELYPGVIIPKTQPYSTSDVKPPKNEEKIVYKSGVTLKHEVREEVPTEMAPNSRIVTIKPDIREDSDGDSISLEDFLAETETGKEPEKILIKEDAPQDTMQGSASPAYSDMGAMLEALQKTKADYSAKIEQIDKQIDAIHMVQQMMRNGVAKS